MPTPPFTVQIRGENLTALAAALRLARLGHAVQLVSPSRPWHDRSPRPLAAGLPPVLELPAAWKDLFSKTGRSMDAELAGLGLSLAEAPATVHLRDGDPLALPTERAAQLAAVRTRFGEAAADAWASVLDDADRSWQARRRFGLEYPVVGRPRLRDLPRDWVRDRGPAAPRDLPPQLSRILADLGPIHGGTGCGGTARGRAGRRPGGPLLLADLAVDRVFGRWYLTGPDGPSGSLQPLLDLLGRRLGTRGVQVLDAPPAGRPDVVILTEPPALGSVYLAPAVEWSRRQLPAGASSTDPAPGVAHTVDHTDDGPVERWQWATGGQLVSLVHDHTRPVPSPAAGPAMSGTRVWARRPPMQWRVDDAIPALYAGPASHGGPESWAQLLTGALAAYGVHHRLTGVDVSPHNRAIGADGRPRRHLPPHLSA